MYTLLQLPLFHRMTAPEKVQGAMLMSDELVSFYKALADANRLKIIGLLARQAYSVEELAALLELKPSTVSHHLARLTQVGLVSAHSETMVATSTAVRPSEEYIR